MENRTVTFKVSQDMYEHLVESTHEKSLLDKKHYCLSDIIRMSLDKSYPMAKKTVLPEKGASGKCQKKRKKQV